MRGCWWGYITATIVITIHIEALALNTEKTPLIAGKNEHEADTQQFEQHIANK